MRQNVSTIDTTAFFETSIEGISVADVCSGRAHRPSLDLGCAITLGGGDGYARNWSWLFLLEVVLRTTGTSL
jgi:hypothetical protein